MLVVASWRDWYEREHLPRLNGGLVSAIALWCVGSSLNCGGKSATENADSARGGSAEVGGTASAGGASPAGASGPVGGTVPGSTPFATAVGGTTAVANSTTIGGTSGFAGAASSSVGGALATGGSSACLAVSCADMAANCGYAPDGCNGLVYCGDCSAGQECGVSKANVCATQTNVYGCPNPTYGFCSQLADCTCESQPTTVTGTVLAPNGTLPIPNALVYVPNGSTTYPFGLVPFQDGVPAFRCPNPSNPIVETRTGSDGTFYLSGVPVGTNIPLVIQLGHFRRVVAIPTVAACGVTTLDASLTTLPSRQSMGNALDSIPMVALATGADDAFECVLRKFGIEDSEFSNAGGVGRIHLYRDNGSICPAGRASCTGTTPDYHQLTASQAALNRYDAVIFPCDGAAHDIDAAEKSRVLDDGTNTSAYVNQGGVALFTHFSYAWLYNQPPLNALPWRSTTSAAGVDGPSTLTHTDAATNVLVDTATSYGYYFSQWLGLPAVNALDLVNPPTLSVVRSRWNLDNPANLSGISNSVQRWMVYPNNSPNIAMLAATVDMPWGSWPSSTNGRIIFASIDVVPSTAPCAGSANNASSCSFPDECDTNLTAQEKALAYLLFDMTDCGQTPPQYCWPKRCTDLPGACGLASDGCGSVLDCRSCCATPPVAMTCTEICADPSQGCSATADASHLVPCFKPDGIGGSVTCYCLLG